MSYHQYQNPGLQQQHHFNRPDSYQESSQWTQSPAEVIIPTRNVVHQPPQAFTHQEPFLPHHHQPPLQHHQHPSFSQQAQYHQQFQPYRYDQDLQQHQLPQIQAPPVYGPYSGGGLHFDGVSEAAYKQPLNAECPPPPVPAPREPLVNVPQVQNLPYSITKPQVQSPPQEPPLDYQVLLLSLADEYLAAARGSGMMTALVNRSAQPDQYYKLIAQALGCTGSVLKNAKLQPQKEAVICLKYAQLLFEETENYDELETLLSRGVESCERNKLLDLKYIMQLLLARVLQRSNSKTALKDIDRNMADIEAYRHTAYEYAFGFLRVHISLGSGSTQDFQAAIHQLEKTAKLARSQADHAVFAFASITESLLHLQGPEQDSVELSQRALATARQLQLNPDISQSPQMQMMMEFSDLCCNLLSMEMDAIVQKLSNMQKTMDQIVEDPKWENSGIFYVPFNRRSLNGIMLSGYGPFSERDGRVTMAFEWLPRSDVYALGYLFSTIGVAYKNASDGHKAEKFLKEGLRLVRQSLQEPEAGSLASATERHTWRKHLELQFLLQQAYLLCDRSEWEAARTTLNEIDLMGHDLGASYPRNFKLQAKYLDSAICQGTGDLDTALEIALTTSLTVLESPAYAAPSTACKTSRNDRVRDVCLLAALNALLIIHVPSHPQHHLVEPVLKSITPYLQNSTSPSPYLQAAHSLVLSTLTSDSNTEQPSQPILRTKQHLGAALQTARQIGNAQITSIALAMMSDKFFKGVVGDQAEKSARASEAMARKSGSKLWGAVAGGMLGECMELQGKMESAEAGWRGAESEWAGVPEGIKVGIGKA